MKIRGPGKRHFALYDVHAPHQTDLTEVLGHISDSGCDHLIIGGDFLDLAWASHWNSDYFARIGFDKVREMYKEGLTEANIVLGKIRKAVGKKTDIWYIPGNHERWLGLAATNQPKLGIANPINFSKIDHKTDLDDLLGAEIAAILRRDLDTDKYSIRVLDYNEPLSIGSILYLHGHQFGGRYPCNSSALRYPHSSVVFGHFHTDDKRTLHNGADPRKVTQHVAVPCLTKLAPGFLKDKSTRWLNGFWRADFNSDGHYDGRVIKVFGGKLI